METFRDTKNLDMIRAVRMGTHVDRFFPLVFKLKRDAGVVYVGMV